MASPEPVTTLVAAVPSAVGTRSTPAMPTVKVAVAAAVPAPPALFAVTVTLYVVADGRDRAGMVQVDPVQAPTVLPFNFQT